MIIEVRAKNCYAFEDDITFSLCVRIDVSDA